MGPIESSEDCRCAEGDNPSSAPILGPFAGPWMSVAKWKQTHLRTSTVVEEPGCVATSSQCPLQDDPYDATVIRLGKPWAMPLSGQDFDSIGPTGATKESQKLRDQSLRDLANAQRDGSQDVNVPLLFSKLSGAQRRVRWKARHLVFKTFNAPQPRRAEICFVRSASRS